jgi:hypothetical protein
MSNKDKEQYAYTDFDYSKTDNNHIPQIESDPQNLRNKIREQNLNIKSLTKLLKEAEGRLDGCLVEIEREWQNRQIPQEDIDDLLTDDWAFLKTLQDVLYDE